MYEAVISIQLGCSHNSLVASSLSNNVFSSKIFKPLKSMIVFALNPSYKIKPYIHLSLMDPTEFMHVDVGIPISLCHCLTQLTVCWSHEVSKSRCNNIHIYIAVKYMDLYTLILGQDPHLLTELYILGSITVKIDWLLLFHFVL